MKTFYIVVAIILAYLAVGAVVTGLLLRVEENENVEIDSDDYGAVMAGIVIWPISAVVLIMRIFCNIAVKIGGKR